MSKKRRKRIYCPNCSVQLKPHMNYCFNCGQENHNKRVSLKMLFSDFISTYFTVDSKILTTLKYLITRPSFLTSEYLDGKIETYLRPIRLYVFISFAFFILIGLTSSLSDYNSQNSNPVVYENQNNQEENSEDTTINTDKSELEIKATNIFSNEKDRNYFLTHLRSKLPILLFIIIPVLAFILFLFFYKKTLYYIDHLVFALHLQSFLFTILFIAWLLDYLIDVDVFKVIATLGFTIYSYIAAKRFYKRTRLSTCLRLIGVGIIHTLLTLFLFVLFSLVLITYY